VRTPHGFTETPILYLHWQPHSLPIKGRLHPLSREAFIPTTPFPGLLHTQESQ